MKRLPFFSFVVVILTGILVAVFFFVFSQSPVRVSTNQITATVSDSAYRAALQKVMKQFVTSYQATSDENGRETLVTQTLNTILNMRVPAEEKSLHLDLAIRLQKMKQGFSGNPQDVVDGYAELLQTLSQVSWLSL